LKLRRFALLLSTGLLALATGLRAATPEITAPKGTTVITQKTDSAICSAIEAWQGAPCTENITVLVIGAPHGLYDVYVTLATEQRTFTPALVITVNDPVAAAAFIVPDLDGYTVERVSVVPIQPPNQQGN
jgi:hypothetical protein